MMNPLTCLTYDNYFVKPTLILGYEDKDILVIFPPDPLHDIKLGNFK